MKVKINEENLTVIKSELPEYNSYYRKGLLIPSIPDGYEITGYVETSDGDKIGVIRYKHREAVFCVIMISIASILGITISVISLLNSNHSNTNYDTHIDTSTQKVTSSKPLDSNPVILKYRSFVSFVNGTIDLGLVNGSKKATVEIKGDGVSSEEVKIKPEEELFNFPVKVKSKEKLIPVTLVYKLDGESKQKEYKVTIENNNAQNIKPEDDTTFQYEEVITD
jgi:hypothetical protein